MIATEKEKPGGSMRPTIRYLCQGINARRHETIRKSIVILSFLLYNESSFQEEGGVMNKIALVLIVSAIRMGVAHAEEGTHWEQVGANDWISWYGQKQEEAVIRLTRSGNMLQFTLRAVCNNSRTFVVRWRRGDMTAHGFDCNGKSARFPTELFETWVNPLPRELRSPTPVKSDKKQT